MASRKILLLLTAAAIALVTVFAVRGMMAPEEQPTTPQAALPTLEIVAASHDLPMGTILKEMDLKWVSWPANADTSSLFVKGKTNLSEIAGAVVRDGFRSGEPIIAARVAHAHDQGFLAAVLGPGMRAMSISLSPSAEVAGFIFPGDHVDVVMTHNFSRKDSNTLIERRISDTILRDVRVLALDQRSNDQSTDPKVAQIATLEVDEKQAEKLALAIDMSANGGAHKASLALVLRGIANSESPIVDKPLLPTWDSEISAAFPPVNGEDQLQQRVQVMRGKTTTENTFERHR